MRNTGPEYCQSFRPPQYSKQVPLEVSFMFRSSLVRVPFMNVKVEGLGALEQSAPSKGCGISGRLWRPHVDVKFVYRKLGR